MKKIYFAGPDVFRPDYEKHAARVKELALAAGFEPLLPGDAELADSLDIFKHNLNLIDEAAAVVANLAAFRGPVEPDSGTVFECAYAFAGGKPVIGIVPDQRDLAARLNLAPGALCPNGWQVENFGLPLNLMLAHALTRRVLNLDEALAALKDLEGLPG